MWIMFVCLFWGFLGSSEVYLLGCLSIKFSLQLMPCSVPDFNPVQPFAGLFSAVISLQGLTRSSSGGGCTLMAGIFKWQLMVNDVWMNGVERTAVRRNRRERWRRGVTCFTLAHRESRCQRGVWDGSGLSLPVSASSNLAPFCTGCFLAFRAHNDGKSGNESLYAN